MKIKELYKLLMSDDKGKEIPKYIIYEDVVWYYVEDENDYNECPDGCGDNLLRSILVDSDTITTSELKALLDKDIKILILKEE